MKHSSQDCTLGLPYFIFSTGTQEKPAAFLYERGNSSSPPVRKGRKEEVVPDPPILWLFLRRRVNPHAASGSGGWNNASPLFRQLQKSA